MRRKVSTEARSDERVLVLPIPGGWSVQSAFVGAPLLFLSAVAAEEKAKALAERLAAAGCDALVMIHDQTHALSTTIRYFGAEI